jgi:7,8-dihydropterin-6-yl-methyl-4-(beta-D-ribofuranosyl)aminobenzene 5'-phosphate synthase
LFKESYSLKGNKAKYIGIPFNKTALEHQGAEFIYNREFSEIAPGIYLTGEVPRTNDYELGDQGQVIKDRDTKGQDAYIKDPLLDDQSLIIRTEQGLMIILGCSHAGLINILNYAIKVTGEERIHTVIGGTHLGPVSGDQREKSIAALQDFQIERLGVSHCTGLMTSLQLEQIFKDRHIFCTVGTVVEI